MCPPDHFAVEYAINPWMDPGEPVDRARAARQWRALRAAFLSLGHDVRLVEAVPGLPDMVFAANAATVIGGRVLGARFRYSERAPEGPAYLEWLRAHGYRAIHTSRYVNEGEGDIIFAHDTIVAGYGFRTDPAVLGDLARIFGLPSVGLRLVDPRFYHLDTALCVLRPGLAAYYPPAFDDAGRRALASVFGELIEASDADAEVFGLNAVSDGRHVVLPRQAAHLAEAVAAAGLRPVGVDMSEFRKAGAGPKCCTLELRP